MLAKGINRKIRTLATAVVLLPTLFMISSATAYAAPAACGSGDDSYTPSIEVGCKGTGSALTDLTFAAIRFLSIGIGLVIVASLTYAGIQYIGSRGDPNATAQAVKRIQSNVTALLLFIFAYAIINYVVPGTFFQ